MEIILQKIFYIVLFIVTFAGLFVRIDHGLLSLGLLFFIYAVINILTKQFDLIDLYSRALYAAIYDEDAREKFKKSIGGDK